MIGTVARTLFAALIGTALCTMPAGAVEQGYRGAWMITASEPAPWASPETPPVPSDLKALMGKTVTFLPRRIAAPRPLACAKPVYVVKSYSRDMLFQGGLTDPAKQASALGFTGAAVRTLETGCEFDFHFVAAGKAMFALNNLIYVMERRTH